jgi:hypothetical protein
MPESLFVKLQVVVGKADGRRQHFPAETRAKIADGNNVRKCKRAKGLARSQQSVGNGGQAPHGYRFARHLRLSVRSQSPFFNRLSAMFRVAKERAAGVASLVRCETRGQVYI